MKSAVEFIFLPEVDSTNDYLRNYAVQNVLDVPVLLLAGYQTAGRGQHTNSWHSEPDKNLLLSLLIEEVISVEKAFYLSKITALAIQQLLWDEIGEKVFVKWTNDIYVADKKIAGVLIENTMKGNKITRSIIGIGLNLNQMEFPDYLPNPISLKQITGKNYDIQGLGMKFYDNFQKIFLKFHHGFLTILDNDYNNCLYKKNQWIRIKVGNQNKMVKVLFVNPEGFLIVENKNGKQEQFTYGEIQFL